MKKNPTEPTVELTIGEETYKLLWTFEALADAEEATGIPLVLGITRKVIESPRIAQVRAFLFACLKPCDENIAYAEAAALVTAKTVQDIWAKVLEAWSVGMKEQSKESAGDPPKGQS